MSRQRDPSSLLGCQECYVRSDSVVGLFHRSKISRYTLRIFVSLNKKLNLRSFSFISNRHVSQTGSAPLYVFSQNSQTFGVGSFSILVLRSKFTIYALIA